MQKITTSSLTNAQLKITDFSLVASIYEGCIIKMQKITSDNWGFVNLSNPAGFLNKDYFPNLHGQIFEKPTSLVFTIIQHFINLDFYLFESEIEFYQWSIDNLKQS